MNNFSREFMNGKKIIGLLGGMSSQATMRYYEIINNEVKKHEGGHNIAEFLLYSVNFQNIENFVSRGDWKKAAEYLTDKAKRIEAGGADFFLLTTNTMHYLAKELEQSVSIPFLHIIDAVAEEVLKKEIKKVGILGTMPVMRDSYYREKYEQDFGIETVVPNEFDRAIVDRIIFQELCHGIVKEESRKEYIRIMENLVEGGAQGILLACTEIEMLVSERYFSICPLFETMEIHAKKAALYSLCN